MKWLKKEKKLLQEIQEHNNPIIKQKELGAIILQSESLGLTANFLQSRTVKAL